MTQMAKYTEMWQDCLDRLRLSITEEEFVKWFNPIRPIDYDGSVLRLRVPNESFVSNIEKRYLSILLPIVSELYGSDIQLKYAVPRRPQASVENASTQVP
jgi:chromosomal replication initiator protein